MRLPGGVPGVRDWTWRQVVLGVVLLVLFVAVAALVPVLIQPDDSGPEAGSTPGTSSGIPAPSGVGVPTASPPTSTVSPVSPTPAPEKSTSDFQVRPAVKARPVGDPPRAVYQEFPSACALVRASSKAPVAGLSSPGAGEGGYDVFGSTRAKPAEPGRVPSGATSCLNPGDRSTYWVPQVLQGGRALEPESFQVLYKAAVSDYTSVQPFPAGLRVLAGGQAAAPSAADGSAVSWSCTGYDEPRLPVASTCQEGDRLIGRIAAPGCWDGRHLDVPGHRSHLAWAASGRCPGSHPVAVPTLLVRVAYPIDVTQEVRLSGLRGQDFGFGVVTGWQPKVLRDLVGDCINAGEHCGETGSPN
nr:DUF1996 domain-containing protein [Kineosporia rhizophila]